MQNTNVAGLLYCIFTLSLKLILLNCISASGWLVPGRRYWGIDALHIYTVSRIPIPTRGDGVCTQLTTALLNMHRLSSEWPLASFCTRNEYYIFRHAPRMTIKHLSELTRCQHFCKLKAICPQIGPLSKRLWDNFYSIHRWRLLLYPGLKEVCQLNQIGCNCKHRGHTMITEKDELHKLAREASSGIMWIPLIERQSIHCIFSSFFREAVPFCDLIGAVAWAAIEDRPGRANTQTRAVVVRRHAGTSFHSKHCSYRCVLSRACDVTRFAVSHSGRAGAENNK